MKFIVSLGLLMFVLSFCNLSRRAAQLFGGDSSTKDAAVGSSENGTAPARAETAEQARMTAEQRAIFDEGQTVEWENQGIAWTLPVNWKKMDIGKTTFNYRSPSEAFLLVNVSVMPDDFPSDISLKATFDSALQQLKNGNYENARYLEIDGVKGVEFVEAMPEDKNGARRFQWLAFRKYLGQNQMLNVMLSTRGSNFERQRDIFPAVLYSMKIGK